MGLFDFVKDAGEKILHREGKAEAKAEARAAAEEAERDRNQANAQALTKVIDALDLGMEQVAIQVQGSVATVYGKAPSQSVKEKIVLVIGNTAGIEQVNDQIIVEKNEPPATMYTVVSGDTLSKIAKTHYGDASAYMKIFEANTPMLKDPNKIYPGQVLRIPPKG